MVPALTDTLPAGTRRVIVVLDVVESVRLMEGDEQGFIARWQRFVRRARDEVLPDFGGRIHKSTGDGLMLEFTEPQRALAAAFELHRLSAAENAGRADDERIRLRIAAHVTEFVADEYDIYGRGVNLTARLLGVAGPGDVCISAALRELLGDAMAAPMQDAGTHRLRHLRDPVRVFRICASRLGAASA